MVHFSSVKVVGGFSQFPCIHDFSFWLADCKPEVFASLGQHIYTLLRDLWYRLQAVTCTASSVYRNSRSFDTIADLVFSLRRLKSLPSCLWRMLMSKLTKLGLSGEPFSACTKKNDE